MSVRDAARDATALSPDEDAGLKRDWRLFTALSFLFSFGFAVYSGVFQNFLRDSGMGVTASRLGQLESLREVPGLLAAITAGTLVALAESRVAGLGLFITALGIGATGFMGHYSALVAITVFWSVGFHLWASVSSAITLTLARGKEGGRHLGRMSAIGAAATLAGLATAFAVSYLLPKPVVPGTYGHANGFNNTVYMVSFAIAGVSIMASALLCWMLSTPAKGTEAAAPRARIVLRREYGLFYLLTFLEGCRRQIFSIFASFALILVYHQPLGAMLALQFINSILITLTAPHIGKLVDKRGERGPLTFYSIGLIVVFLGYATTRTVGALYALFLLDNILFTFGVGFTTYLHRIVRPGELTPCLSMGVTMNHIAAVTVPVGGAWLWDHYHNYQLPFWVGVTIACFSLLATRWLPTMPLQKAERHAPVYVVETPPQEEAQSLIP